MVRWKYFKPFWDESGSVNGVLDKRSFVKFQKQTKSYSAKSMSSRGSILWNTFDDSIKQEQPLARLKNKISH